MSAIPKALQDAARKAEEKHKAIYSEPQETEGKPEEGGQQAQGQEGDKPKAEESRQATEQPPAQKLDSVDWQSKYNTLKGKYDAEVPRLAADLRSLKAEKQELQQQLEQLKQQAPAPKDTGNDGVSADAMQRLRDEYGDEFADLVKQVARSELMNTQAPTQDLAAKVERLEQDHRMTAQERFKSDLTAQVNDWERINTDSAFHSWLAGTDPFTGYMRQDLLDDAGSKLDASRVAAIFNAYKSEAGLTQKPQQDAPKTPSRSVSPGRSRASEGAESKPQYTVADWTKLQEDYRRGKYRHREDEYKRKEAEIHAAIFGNR